MILSSVLCCRANTAHKGKYCLLCPPPWRWIHWFTLWWSLSTSCALRYWRRWCFGESPCAASADICADTACTDSTAMPSGPAVLLCRRHDESHAQRLLVFCYLSEVLVFCYLSEVNRTEDANWPKTLTMCECFYLQASFGCSTNTYTQGVLVFFFSFFLFIVCFQFELLRARPCWLALYQRRARKGWLGTYFHGSFDTHVGHVLWYLQTQCWAQNGSTHGRVLASQTSILWQTGRELEWKTTVCIYFIVFHSCQ